MFTQRQSNIIIWTTIALYTALMGTVCVWKYWHLGYNALDVAILNNALWHSLHGNWLGSSIHPPSYIGDHFTPLLLGLLPIYALAPSPETLLIAQTIILALCAWPIALIARKFFDRFDVATQNLAATLAALLWLANPFVHNINLFEFHATPFALPALLFGFWFYQQKKFWPMLGCIAISLLVQEDVAIAASGLGLLALLDRRSPRWWLGLWAVCGGYFLIANQIITSVNPDGYKYLVYYSWLGDTPKTIILTALLQPWRVVARILSPNALVFVGGLLLPFAFLPLLKPKYLLLGAGIAAQLMLGSSGGSDTLLQLHYPSLLLPALSIAAIAGAARWCDRQPFRRRRIEQLHATPELASLLCVAAIGYGSIMLGPLHGLPNAFSATDQTVITSLLQQIPPDASVGASYGALSLVSSRDHVAALNYVFLGKQQFLQRDYQLPEATNYVLLDPQDLVAYRLQYGANPFYADQYAKAIHAWPHVLENFSVIDRSGGHILLHKTTAADNKLIQSIATTSAPILHTFGSTASIRKADVHDNTLTLVWQLGMAPAEEPVVRLTTDNRHTTPVLIPLGYGLLPTSRWQPGAMFRAQYDLPLSTKKHAHVYIELIRPIGGGIDLDALRRTVITVDRAESLGQPFTLPTE